MMKSRNIAVLVIAFLFMLSGLYIPMTASSQAGPPDELPPLDLPDVGPPGPGPGAPGAGLRPGAKSFGPGAQSPLGLRTNRRDRRVDRIKKDDPERYERIVKIRELADEYRSAEDQKSKDKIEKELRKLVDEELKIQQEEAREKVKDWEKKLQEFKDVLKKRDENWNEVVDYNVKKITGQADYLEFHQVPLK